MFNTFYEYSTYVTDEVMQTNWYTDYRIFDGFQQNFFSALVAIFFQAAYRNPRRSQHFWKS